MKTHQTGMKEKYLQQLLNKTYSNKQVILRAQEEEMKNWWSSAKFSTEAR